MKTFEKYLNEDKFKILYNIYHFGLSKATTIDKVAQKNGKDREFDNEQAAKKYAEKEQKNWGDNATFRIEKIKGNENKQDDSLEELEKRNFKINKESGGNIYLSLKLKHGTVSAVIELNGDVNGMDLKTFLKDLPKMMGK